MQPQTERMPVRKIHGSWWVDVMFKKKRYRLRCPDKRREQAVVYEHRIVAKLVAGEPLELSRDAAETSQQRRFDAFSAFWYETHVKVNLKPSTQSEYASVLKRVLVPYFGKLDLSDIGTLTIDRFKAKRQAAGASAKTINNDLGIFSRLMKSAAEWGIVRTVPRVTFLKTDPAETRYLTPAESRRLLEHTASPFWRLFFFVALRTGLRAGEIIALRWEDIDLNHRLIVVRRSIVSGVVGIPKSRRFRYVALASDLHQLLAAVRRDTGYVFARPGDEPIAYAAAAKALRTACRRAGMPRFGLHAFRHSFASHLVMQGQDLYSVQRLLGHTDPKMTQRYAHLAPAYLLDVVDALPRADGGLAALVASARQPVVNSGEQEANMASPSPAGRR